MVIEQLLITNVRNIKSLALEFSPQLNIIHGNNGSGKTSVLEAAYLLHVAKSFRSTQVQPVLRYNESHCTVFAKCSSDLTLGLQKSRGSTLIKRNQTPLLSAAELASLFPVVLIYQDLFSVIDQGPSVRRRLLDWGVFHVEPSFKDHWQTYKRALLQRNNALKQNFEDKVITSWDEVLANSAEQLSSLRTRYLNKLNQVLSPLLSKYELPEVSVSFHPGWKEENYKKTLTKNLKTDKRFKTTSEGPHRADLILTHQKHSLKQAFSRGQKKLFLCVLKFAQAELLNKSCIYLIDDLNSELDKTAEKKVMSYLVERESQVLLTALDPLPYQHLPDSKSLELKDGMLVSRET
jgi:DNA replication and repair protein RecF